MLLQSTCFICVRCPCSRYLCLLLVGGRSLSANPSTTGGSCSTATTLTSGRMQHSLSDSCCWILRGGFFRGGIRNSARICNGFIKGFAPTWDYVSCSSAFCDPACPRATLAQGVAEVANTTSFSSNPALSPLSRT